MKQFCLALDLIVRRFGLFYQIESIMQLIYDMDYSTTINEIEQFMKKFGGYYSDWYVGIATDPRDRLFNDHSVNEQNDSWIFGTVDTDDLARSVEQYFLIQRKTDGGPGGGSNSSKTVYAYKKTSTTQQ